MALLAAADEDVRAEALEGLARVGGREAMDALGAFAERSFETGPLREAAREAQNAIRTRLRARREAAVGGLSLGHGGQVTLVGEAGGLST